MGGGGGIAALVAQLHHVVIEMCISSIGDIFHREILKIIHGMAGLSQRRSHLRREIQVLFVANKHVARRKTETR